MTKSIEILYHFSCKECKGWWSIAMENFYGIGGYPGIGQRKWFCPWCGVEQYYDEGDIPVGGEISNQKDN